MKRIFQTAVIISLLLLAKAGFCASPEFELIRKKIVTELMAPPVNDAKVKELVATIKPDGTWPDINYVDVSREGFENRHHHANMVVMARAYKTKTSAFYKSKKVKSAIELALKHWVEKDYICDNWHPNQIGTPSNLVYLMLMMGNELPADLVQKAQPIIGRAHLNASGARPSGDRIKIAGILAKNLLFLGDEPQFAEAMKVIEGEIKFATGQRGMQHDYSFHHREDRVNNTLSYGTGYADAFAEWAAYVAGTKYAFSQEKVKQLTDYYLDGICKQMVYGKYEDTGTKNRDISRADDENAMGTTSPERLITVSDYRKDELIQIVKIRNGELAQYPSFDKFFWQTEHYVHQRPGYFASVRMHSVRNDNMEVPYNSEGLKNHHRGDGTNHISVTGLEYLNIAPVFDWQKIPGATILQKPAMPAENEIQKKGLTEFVGAVTDGKYGAVAYDFKSPHDPVSAKKAWFFFDNEYVCLGTGISAASKLPLATTLNQCLLNGDVVIKTGQGQKTVSKGERQLEQVNWILHDGIGYVFPEAQKVNLSNQAQTGSWFSINRQTDSPKEEMSLEVFKLWIDHGPSASNAAYQYIVVPGATTAELERNTSRNILILANTPQMQAVMHSGLNIGQMIFHTSGEMELGANLKIGSDTPGIVMVKMEDGAVKQISVADPSRKLRRMHLTLTGKFEKTGDHFRAIWNEKKCTTDFAIDLPQTVYAGKSVTIEL